MQASRPVELISNYNKSRDSNTETVSAKSRKCQRSTKAPTSNVSGKEIQKNISGFVSECSSKSSNKTIKSDSNKTSKFSEELFQSQSPKNWDTPSFTENLNTYDFVLQQKDNLLDSEVNAFHGLNQSQGRGPTIHNTAFCYDDGLSFNNSMTKIDSNILDHPNEQKKFAKNLRDNNKPLKFRANKSSNIDFNQGSQNLDTLNQDIQSRKNKIEQLRDNLLNRFEDENVWIQDLKKVRKNMGPMSNAQIIYGN